MPVKLPAPLRSSTPLQERAGEASKPNLLKDLGAHLTLDRAQRHFGFDAAAAGLSEAQAADIAVLFAQYDAGAGY